LESPLAKAGGLFFWGNGKGQGARGEGRVMSGEWRMANGKWRVASDEWRVENEEWRMKNGEEERLFFLHSPFSIPISPLATRTSNLFIYIFCIFITFLFHFVELLCIFVSEN